MEKYAISEVLTVVVMRNQVFWDLRTRRPIASIEQHSLLYALRSIDTSVAMNQSAQCHIPEDLNLRGKTCSGSTQREQHCNNRQLTAVTAIYSPLNKPQPLPPHVVPTDHNKYLLILLATNILSWILAQHVLNNPYVTRTQFLVVAFAARRSSGTNWTKGLVDPTPSPQLVRKRKTPPLPGNLSPAHRCPDSVQTNLNTKIF
jgi:hypothetical protein